MKLLGKIICFLRDTHGRLRYGKTEISCKRCGRVLSRIEKQKPKEKPPKYDKAFWNGCHGKKAFNSFKEAKERIMQMRKRPETLKPYECNVCGKFHIGNKDGRIYIPS